MSAILLFFVTSTGAAQSCFTLMAYNCENAFDTIHDEGKDDYEFLPEGSYHWSRSRMFRKLNNIGKVIMAVDTEHPVDIVCLEEVENDSVLTWLTQRTALSQIGYKYVMTESADTRGIDVALVYSPFTFRLLDSESLRAKTSSPTRDVLHVCGTTPGGDTLDIFAVHLPSRLNGKVAERNRQIIAEMINSHIDSISMARPNAQICIMGDFNDGPRSNIVKRAFAGMTNLMTDGKQGSYKYHGVWDCIDQILVNESLHGKVTEAGVYSNPMLTEDDIQYGGTKPFRTYIGRKYNKGFSDHLPVFFKIR